MPVMQWNETLALDNSTMDDTHKEFVELLNRVGDAPDDTVLGLIDEFIAHTEEHFEQELKWMQSMHFPPLHCHATEHQGMLDICNEVRNRVASGETKFASVLAQAVAEWFATHVSTMDTVLSLALKGGTFAPAADASHACDDTASQVTCGPVAQTT